MVSSKYYAPIGQTSSEILATKLILKKKITELFLVTLFRIGFFICSFVQRHFIASKLNAGCGGYLG